MLQALEEGALLTVAALLKETQQLASQLKHAEEKVKVCLPHGFLFLSFSCSKQLKHQLVLGDVFLHYHENTVSLSHTHTYRHQLATRNQNIQWWIHSPPKLVPDQCTVCFGEVESHR